MTRTIRTAAGLAFLLVCMAACSKEHDLKDVVNPRDPAISGETAPVPDAPVATIGNRRVELTWALPDSARVDDVDHYRVYRASGDGELSPIDTAAHVPAAFGGLVNGTTYRFAVSAILVNGLEGKRSATVTATPAVYGVQVDGGREATRSSLVTLTLLAPPGTTGMQVANSAGFANASVQPFAAALAWQLEPGDGVREVFARYTDAEGNLSAVVSDRITVDTKAQILSVTFSPETARPGETVAFRLDAEEPNGSASVQLGAGGRRVDLRDDGTAGDDLADDGIYQLDYPVPPDLALVDALVTGEFTDRVGNVATARPASGRLSIPNALAPVELAAIVSPGPGQLFLNWTQSADPGRFSAYRVFRAEAAGVDTSRTRTLVRELTSRLQTTFTDTGLDPNRRYWYRVHVVDNNGGSVTSNEESGQPGLNPPPDPVVLAEPSNVTESTVSLAWSRSLSPAFGQYRIWRGTQADIDQDPDRRLLTSINAAGTTSYEDRTELEQGRTFHYRVDVIDDNGQSTPSNVVSALIPDPAPQPVTLQSPTSIGENAVLLSWTQSNERDFDRYELRRSATAGVGPEAPLLVALTEKEAISHLDTGLVENTDYYYRVFVVDRGGHRTGGNEQRVTTRNEDPAPVTLAAPTEVSGALTPTINLSWTRSGAHDFEEYRIHRDTAPAVGEGSTLVRTIAEQDVLAFQNSGLVDNTRYYFRVFVLDDAGGRAGSNEQSIVTANRAPTPVTLSVGTVTANSIQLNWTQNTNHDFREYRLLQGITSISFPTTVISLTQREQTSHTIFFDQSDTTQYFFKLVVYDKALESQSGLSTDSNVVSARIRPN